MNISRGSSLGKGLLIKLGFYQDRVLCKKVLAFPDPSDSSVGDSLGWIIRDDGEGAVSLAVRKL